MAVSPSKTGDANTWDIKLSLKVNGEQIFIDEVFFGTIREAMFHEMQLRGLAKDGLRTPQY